MYKKILVGYDGSENAKRALNRAIDEAKNSKAELRIAVVADISGYSTYAGVGVYPEPSRGCDSPRSTAHASNNESCEKKKRAKSNTPDAFDLQES